MPNEKNLIPFSARSESEARENGSKGGKASGASRRRKKVMKDRMKAMLELPATDVHAWNEASMMGVPIEDIDNETLLLVALFKKARAGDVAAFKEIRNLLGEDIAAQELAIKKKELKLKEQAVQKATGTEGVLDELIKGLKSDE